MVLRTLSNRLIPVMMRYALVAKELMSWYYTTTIIIISPTGQFF